MCKILLAGLLVLEGQSIYSIGKILSDIKGGVKDAVGSVFTTTSAPQPMPAVTTVHSDGNAVVSGPLPLAPTNTNGSAVSHLVATGVNNGNSSGWDKPTAKPDFWSNIVAFSEFDMQTGADSMIFTSKYAVDQKHLPLYGELAKAQADWILWDKYQNSDSAFDFGGFVDFVDLFNRTIDERSVDYKAVYAHNGKFKGLLPLMHSMNVRAVRNQLINKHEIKALSKDLMTIMSTVTPHIYSLYHSDYDHFIVTRPTDILWEMVRNQSAPSMVSALAEAFHWHLNNELGIPDMPAPRWANAPAINLLNQVNQKKREMLGHMLDLLNNYDDVSWAKKMVHFARVTDYLYNFTDLLRLMFAVEEAGGILSDNSFYQDICSILNNMNIEQWIANQEVSLPIQTVGNIEPAFAPDHNG